MVLHRKHEPRVACPYCWEQVDIDIAEQIDQDFIVDCAVCCHPILVHIRTAGDGKHQIELRRENE